VPKTAEQISVRISEQNSYIILCTYISNKGVIKATLAKVHVTLAVTCEDLQFGMKDQYQREGSGHLEGATRKTPSRCVPNSLHEVQR